MAEPLRRESDSLTARYDEPLISYSGRLPTRNQAYNRSSYQVGVAISTARVHATRL